MDKRCEAWVLWFFDVVVVVLGVQEEDYVSVTAFCLLPHDLGFSA
jgi:hypothetical protein